MKVFGFFSSRRDGKKSAPEDRSKRGSRSEPSSSANPVRPTGSQATPAKADPPAKPLPETAASVQGEARARPTTPPPVPEARQPAAEAATTPEPPAVATATLEQPEAQGGLGPIDELDLDASLAAAIESAGQAGIDQAGSASETDVAAVRDLFSDIASNHAQPVKNFIAELRCGSANKEWIEICRPVMSTLIEGAHSMGLADIGQRMGEFDEALSMAADGDGPRVDDTARELLLEAFEQMSQTLPESFVMGDEVQRRESIIIHSLLKQVPDVGRVTFERLYSAGLTSLAVLYDSRPRDLATTTGVPEWLCERMCERLAEHRTEQETASRGSQHERLEQMVAELKKHHESFQHASEREWTGAEWVERKRESRQKREQTALKIEVALAEMGEIDLADRMQKLPLHQRITALEEFLAGAAGSPNEGA